MIQFQDIVGITFDIDNTLWDIGAALDRAEHAVIDLLASTLTPEQMHSIDFDAGIKIHAEVAHEMHPQLILHPGSWLEDVRRESFHRLISHIPDIHHESLLEQMYDTFYVWRRETIPLFEGTKQVIHQLHERFALGLISNGKTSLQNTSIMDCFDCHVAVHTYELLKPDPEMFYVAARELNLQPAEILHVGDNLHDDIAGAQNVGMKAVWFNPLGEENRTGITPDAEIQHLSQLEQLLRFAR